MKQLGKCVRWYLYITTSILIVYSVIILGIYQEKTIPAAALWQILVSGFLTTVITYFFALREWNIKSSFPVQILCHYLALSMVMLLLGNWFGWIHADLKNTAFMMAAVAAVYLLTFGAHWLIDLRQAEEINRRLKDKYEDEE